MSALFSPLTLRTTSFPNRLWVAPMCQYSAVDGLVGEWHRVHLGSFATGGFGLVMSEATAVSPEGRISIACPGIYRDDQEEAWRGVVEFLHSQGTLAGMQLAHAGRKGSTMQPWADHPFASAQEGGWEAVAPSAIPFEGYPTPRALSIDDLADVRQDFVAAATRALRAGFDVLEIHAAHGYLLHEFMSPLSNQREDEYGGSLENRARLLFEIASDLRALSPTPLFVRVSATDWTEGGLTVDDTAWVAEQLMERGVDLVDVSSGGNVAGAAIPIGPGYQVPLAEALRSRGVTVSAVGLITTADQAEEIVAAGRADAVMVARAALRNPRFALEAAEALGEVIAWPVQFDRARTVRA